MGWEPVSGKLWTSVNERDEIGTDLVPDYMTSVQDGGFYGWPFSYYGQHVDTRVKDAAPRPRRPRDQARLRARRHTASLGLAFADGAAALPAAFADGAFIGQHGSWNRKPFAGYKVIFVPFARRQARRAAGRRAHRLPDADGEAQGRPVGVAIDQRRRAARRRRRRQRGLAGDERDAPEWR